MSGIQNVSVSAAQSYASVASQAQPSLQPFANLDLSEAQRTQLRSILTNAKQDGTSRADVEKQINAILTPAQQQTLSSDIKAGGHFGRHHQKDADASQASGATDDSSESTTSTSADATILDAVTNIQNQAAAAQSTLVETLQQQVRATNGDAANAQS